VLGLRSVRAMTCAKRARTCPIGNSWGEQTITGCGVQPWIDG